MLTIEMSGMAGPLSVYVKEGSRPLTENRQISAVPVPEAGRTIGTLLAPSVQDDVATVYAPIAAMSKLTFPDAPDPPLVLRSTTTMSLPNEDGALGVKGIVAASTPGASTTKVEIFEIVPSGFCSWTGKIPANCRSACVSEVVHSVFDSQDVVRGVPAINIVEPGPGLEASKLFPETSRVNPPADPA